MRTFFITISVTSAAVPGALILGKAIQTPPGYALIFAGFVTAWGAAAFAILFLKRRAIARVAVKKLSIAVSLLIVASTLSFVGYFSLYKWCVVADSIHGTVFMPLWASGELARLIEEAGGGRYDALNEFGPYPLYAATQSMPAYAIPLTVFVLLAAYQFIFTPLTIAFGLLGFRSDAKLEIAPVTQDSENETQ